MKSSDVYRVAIERGTYTPRPISEASVRALIYAAIVRAGSSSDLEGRAFRPTIESNA